MSTLATADRRAVPFDEAMHTLVEAMGGGADGSVTAVERTGRRGEMTPLHVHAHDEVVYVLEGAMTVFVNDESVRLDAGEAFVAPRGMPHTHLVESDEIRYLCATIARSAARYEDFVRAVAVPAEDDSGSWDASGDASRVAALAAPNGIRVLAAPGAVAGA